MFPVLAEQEIQVVQLYRRERLANAERRQVISALASASGSLPFWATSPRRAWGELGSARGILVRFGSARSAQPGDELAASRSV